MKTSTPQNTPPADAPGNSPLLTLGPFKLDLFDNVFIPKVFNTALTQDWSN